MKLNLCRRTSTRSVPGRCYTNRDWPARCPPTGSSPADAIRHWSAELGHPIEDLTAEDDLTPLPSWTPGAKTISDDGLVAELDGDRVIGGVSGDAHERALDRSEQIEGGGRIITRRLGQRVDEDHAGLIDAKVELSPATSAALLHESSLARTMPTDRILTCQCDTTLVGRGRSSDSGSHSRGRPRSPAQLDSGRECYRR